MIGAEGTSILAASDTAISATKRMKAVELFSFAMQLDRWPTLSSFAALPIDVVPDRWRAERRA